MKVIKLHSQITNEFKNAGEVCIASAMVSEAGLDHLLNNISDSCKVQLLIGIDLPTPYSVFKRLLEVNNSNIETRVFLKQGFFHPKLYLIKGRQKTVFVGSGNFTGGGLGDNIELFHKLTDDENYDDYKKWFDKYFDKMGNSLTSTWLEDYRLFYNQRAEIESNNKSDVGHFKQKSSGNKVTTILRNIDFTNQFFKLKHHLAFEGNKPNDRSTNINTERHDVKLRLMDLHELVYPKIQMKGWDLHSHSMQDHITSSYMHSERTSDKIGALWLHYGRSQRELDKLKEAYGDKQTSLYHMRMQVLVRLDDISVWLRVGKSNGSIVDRDGFKQKMKGQSYRDKFFKLLTTLPSEFFISINGVWRDVDSFKSSDELYEFVRHDNIRYYFIIGREYSPDATEVSEKNIANTVISDFGKMLSLYQHIKTTI